MAFTLRHGCGAHPSLPGRWALPGRGTKARARSAPAQRVQAIGPLLDSRAQLTERRKVRGKGGNCLLLNLGATDTRRDTVHTLTLLVHLTCNRPLM